MATAEQKARFFELLEKLQAAARSTVGFCGADAVLYRLEREHSLIYGEFHILCMELGITVIDLNEDEKGRANRVAEAKIWAETNRQRVARASQNIFTKA